MRFHEITNLFEMFLRTPKQDGKLIAYGNSIWIFDYKENIIPEETFAEMDQVIPYKISEYLENYEPGYQHGLFVAHYDYDDNVIQMEQGYNLSPETSVLIKKVANQLGARVTLLSIGYEGEEVYRDISQNQMKGKRPNFLYHGTNSFALKSIFKKGLLPGIKTNWDNIQHQEYVFGTSEIEVAQFHANNSFSVGIKRGMFDEKEFPVIIKFKIPDPAKLGIDFDVAAQLGDDSNPDFSNIPQFWDQYKLPNAKPKHDWAREYGIFSYKGRIPATMITKIIAAEYPTGVLLTEDNAKVFTPKEYIEFVKELNAYDDEDNYDEDEEEDY